MKNLVSLDWLLEHKDRDNLVLIDVLCGVGQAEEREEGISGAIKVDLDKEGSDHSTGLPHSMLNTKDFQNLLRSLGLNGGEDIVLYDSKGINSAARFWWMLQSVGIQSMVLNGGLKAYEKENLPLARFTEPSSKGNIDIFAKEKFWADMGEVRDALNDDNTVVVDARSEGRFNGTDPEPRKGLPSGHMPNAINLPFTQLLDNGFLADNAIEKFTETVGEIRTVITTCGSGVTASVLAFIAKLADYDDVRVYDGSWSEWALPENKNPIERV